MALWQVDFLVLPKQYLENLNPTKLDIDEAEGFNATSFWQPSKTPHDFFKSIGKFMPESKSWDSMSFLYGNQDSTCFEVLYKNNLVESVSFRIDFTSDYEAILRALIAFFILNDLIVIDGELTILPLNFEAIKSVIENSPQVRNRLLLSQYKK